MIEYFCVMRDDTLEIEVHAFGAHIAQTENDDCWQLGPTGSQEITKIQVMCEDNAFLTAGLLQYFQILQPSKTLLVQVHRQVPEIPKKAHRLG